MSSARGCQCTHTSPPLLLRPFTLLPQHRTVILHQNPATRTCTLILIHTCMDIAMAIAICSSSVMAAVGTAAADAALSSCALRLRPRVWAICIYGPRRGEGRGQGGKGCPRQVLGRTHARQPGNLASPTHLASSPRLTCTAPGSVGPWSRKGIRSSISFSAPTKPDLRKQWQVVRRDSHISHI